jgi:hypothetical protein
VRITRRQTWLLRKPALTYAFALLCLFVALSTPAFADADLKKQLEEQNRAPYLENFKSRMWPSYSRSSGRRSHRQSDGAPGDVAKFLENGFAGRSLAVRT